MNEVQKFILSRAMNKVANKGMQKKAGNGVMDTIKGAYNNATDWMADKMTPMFNNYYHNKTMKDYTGYVTDEAPYKAVTSRTPITKYHQGNVVQGDVPKNVGERRLWDIEQELHQTAPLNIVKRLRLQNEADRINKEIAPITADGVYNEPYTDADKRYTEHKLQELFPDVQ